MKEAQSSRESAEKKQPRRRMYQDVKFDTLLHSAKSSKSGRNFAKNNFINCKSGIKLNPSGTAADAPTKDEKQQGRSTTCRQNVIWSNNSTGSKDKSSAITDFAQQCSFPVQSVGDHDIAEIDNVNKRCTKLNTLNIPDQENNKETKKFKSQTAIFQKYLYNNQLVRSSSATTAETNSHSLSSCQESSRLKDGKSINLFPRNVQRKSRVERRHTATGTSGLTMKEIENWLSNEKKTASEISQDDSVILIKKTEAMKKVETTICYKLKEKISNDTHDLPSDGKEKKADSCIEVFVDDSHKPASDANDANSNDIDCVKRKEICKTLVNGEKTSRINCFLSPRPYKHNEKMIAQARSWNGEVKTETTTDPNFATNGQQQEIKNHSRSCSSYILDHDDYSMSALEQKMPRGRTKYDTFLDLSNLDLDEDDYDDQKVEYVFNSKNGPSLSESDTYQFKKPYSINDPRIGDHDFTREEVITPRSSCSFLEKIDEHPLEAEYVHDMDQSLKVDEPTDTTPDSFTMKDQTSEGNNHENDVLTSEEEIPISNRPTSEDSGEPTLDQKKDKAVAAGLGEDSTQDEGASDSEDINSSSVSIPDKSESIDCVSSLRSAPTCLPSSFEGEKLADLNSNEQLKCYDTSFVCSKTASLDRCKFQKPDVTVDENFSNKQSNDFDTSANEITTNNTMEKSSHMSINRLWNMVTSTVKGSGDGKIKIKDILSFIETKGIKRSDPRLRKAMNQILSEKNGLETDLNGKVFSRIFEPTHKLIRSLMLSQLSVPGFSVFKMRIASIFDKIQEIIRKESDNVSSTESLSSYDMMMKKLRNENPDLSLSICTVDGQRCSFGSEEIPHPLNICATVFNYCLACRQNGVEAVSYFLADAFKPAEKSEFMLSKDEKVWNPFTKCGSILTSSLLFREMAIERRLSALHDFYRELIGHELLCCDNLSFNYKRIYAHEEIGLAYFLSCSQRLPRGTSADLSEFLDFHFQAASSAMTSDACAIGAATLANDGVCPLTGTPVLDKSSIRHALSVIRKSYQVNSSQTKTQNYSIVSAWNDDGGILIIVPGVLGISCFLHCRNAIVVQKVVESLTKELTSSFNFEVYKSLKERRDTLLQN